MNAFKSASRFKTGWAINAVKARSSPRRLRSRVVHPDKGTSVERRYSDFVWLVESLTKRYPFRLLVMNAFKSASRFKTGWAINAVKARSSPRRLRSRKSVWTVVHPDKGTSVERRYSDFVWLVESLTKRYPFRSRAHLVSRRGGPSTPSRRVRVRDASARGRVRPSMQGWAFVKHHVWTVVHPDKGTSVERRYSDFVWLVHQRRQGAFESATPPLEEEFVRREVVTRDLDPFRRVQVVLKGDMQGWAFVKHHVWTVVHPDKGTSVERRYSESRRVRVRDASARGRVRPSRGSDPRLGSVSAGGRGTAAARTGPGCPQGRHAGVGVRQTPRMDRRSSRQGHLSANPLALVAARGRAAGAGVAVGPAPVALSKL
jgi:hypothetical protein